MAKSIILDYRTVDGCVRKTKKHDSLVVRFFVCVANLRGIASLVSTSNLIFTLSRNIVIRIKSVEFIFVFVYRLLAVDSLAEENSCCLHNPVHSTIIKHFLSAFNSYLPHDTMYEFLIKIHASLYCFSVHATNRKVFCLQFCLSMVSEIFSARGIVAFFAFSWHFS